MATLYVTRDDREPLERLLNSAEAADTIGITRYAVETLVRQGRPPFIRVGVRGLAFREADILEFANVFRRAFGRGRRPMKYARKRKRRKPGPRVKKPDGLFG